MNDNKDCTSDETYNEAQEYIDFSPRMYASIIDILWTSVFIMPLSWISMYIYGESDVQKIMNQKTINEGQEVALNYLMEEGLVQMVQDSIVRDTPIIIVFLIVIILFWTRSSTTPGKLLLNMKIIDYKTGKNMSIRQSIIHIIAYIFSILPLCLGFMMMNVNKQRRCLHDYIAGTAAVKLPEYERIAFFTRLQNWFRIGNK